MADGKKICKGCNVTVARPVTCGDCKVASHPGCLSRTGHPFSDGKFKSCNGLDDGLLAPLSLGSESEDRILGFIRAEFDKFNQVLVNFKQEIREMYLKDMAGMQQNIQDLTDRIEQLEKGTNSSANPAAVTEEEIMSELQDRERRSNNIMIYNLEEPSSNESMDLDIVNVKGAIQAVKKINVDNKKIIRLGVKRQGITRPVKVILNSREDVLDIVKNKFRCRNPVRIDHDRTHKQRKHLQDLKEQLRSLHEAGHEEKTIRYINGVPKIIDVRHSQQKN